MLLPLHKQAQHLTLALTCCRKRERRRSGRWRQSGAVRGSAMCTAWCQCLGPPWSFATLLIWTSHARAALCCPASRHACWVSPAYCP